MWLVYGLPLVIIVHNEQMPLHTVSFIVLKRVKEKTVGEVIYRFGSC